MDRRLGRPLPHQLPNPTRANPKAINLSPEGHIRYYSQFPEAIPYLWAYSHALLTRPPLPPKRALDLHVLGLPPAFVLSQDQTLKLKAPCGTVLDVRTSAHLHPTEVGCHICPMHIVPRERSPYKTVKLTLTSSGPKPLASRYASFVHRNEPNRPHISSDIINVKKRRSQQPTSAPYLVRRAARSNL